MLNGPTAGLDDNSFFVRFKRGFKFGRDHYGKSLVLLLVLLFLTSLLMQPIAFVLSMHQSWNNEPWIPDLLDMAADFIKRIAQIYTNDYMVWANAFRQFVYVLFMLGILPLMIIVFALAYYSELEKTEVKGLRRAFEKFGKRSRSRETEVDFE